MQDFEKRIAELEAARAKDRKIIAKLHKAIKDAARLAEEGKTFKDAAAIALSGIAATDVSQGFS